MSECLMTDVMMSDVKREEGTREEMFNAQRSMFNAQGREQLRAASYELRGERSGCCVWLEGVRINQWPMR